MPGREQKDRMPPSVKYWEIIADNLSKARWNWGSISAIDSNGRTIWIADAHRGDGKRFVSDAEEKLRAFLELESAIRAAECPEDYPTFERNFGWAEKEGLNLRRTAA